jgi:hypothetical protein
MNDDQTRNKRFHALNVFVKTPAVSRNSFSNECCNGECMFRLREEAYTLTLIKLGGQVCAGRGARELPPSFVLGLWRSAILSSIPEANTTE